MLTAYIDLLLLAFKLYKINDQKYERFDIFNIIFKIFSMALHVTNFLEE